MIKKRFNNRKIFKERRIIAEKHFEKSVLTKFMESRSRHEYETTIARIQNYLEKFPFSTVTQLMFFCLKLVSSKELHDFHVTEVGVNLFLNFQSNVQSLMSD